MNNQEFRQAESRTSSNRLHLQTSRLPVLNENHDHCHIHNHYYQDNRLKMGVANPEEGHFSPSNADIENAKPMKQTKKVVRAKRIQFPLESKQTSSDFPRVFAQTEDIENGARLAFEQLFMQYALRSHESIGPLEGIPSARVTSRSPRFVMSYTDYLQTLI